MIKLLRKIFRRILGKNKPQITHLTLEGVIGKGSRFEKGLNFDSVFPLLQKAFANKETKAVAISINSPGGSPVQSELIYNAIRELSTAKKIPVYTFAQDVAASGGYWLLLAGDETYAHNASIIGSIGVIFSSFGFVEAIKKLGIERRIYAEGKNKAILDPFLPEEKENIAILKDAQKDIFENFKELVLSRRKGKLRDEKGEILDENSEFLNDKIFTGAFWAGKTAQKLGLVDEIGDLRAVMKQKFGEKIQIIEISEKKSLLKSLFSSKTQNFAQNLLDEIENRLDFAKFGK